MPQGKGTYGSKVGRPRKKSGLLQDDREQYGLGGKVISAILKNTEAFAGRKGKITIKDAKKELKDAKEKIREIKQDPDMRRMDEQEYLEVLVDDLEVKIRMIEEDIASEYVARGLVAEGGPMSMDDQMLMVMTEPQNSEMESDDNMEDNYTRFIMDEALTEDEEDMLMSKLEQDEELQMLFDKVIDVAQEFAGSGPVDGPGSGVSDSIPARLSDGEFVFTAKAVEEIGEDTLMSMMKDAEAQADERQGMQDGGMFNKVEEEKVDQFGKPIDSDIARDELKKSMLSVNPRYQ